MKFEDLKFLTFEGGGAKGAVYEGAIIALQEKFNQAWHQGKLKKFQNGQFVDAPPTDGSPPDQFMAAIQEQEALETSLLDYYEIDDSGRKLHGISGASAGAITAFPLALGLAADDIHDIVHAYPFSEELLPSHNLNEGKYRMVGMIQDQGTKISRAAIFSAEDHFKKLGEDQIEPYIFSVTDHSFKESSQWKGWIREKIISAGISIILTGLKDNWPIVSRILASIVQVLDRYNPFPRWSAWLKANATRPIFTKLLCTSWVSEGLADVTSKPWNLIIGQLLKIKFLDRLPTGNKFQFKFFKLLPADNAIPAIGNVLWDRGMYSAFEVREFFFKILLKALSKDTCFKRGFAGRDDLLESLGLTTDKLDAFRISFDDKYQATVNNDDEDSQHVLDCLTFLPEKLTFREFYAISGVELAICVTNATTNQPLYFSRYFTPDFPVLEAVGASMSFPIAFKPIYSEASVLLAETLIGGDSDTTYLEWLCPEFVTQDQHKTTKYVLRNLLSRKDVAQANYVMKEKFDLPNYNKNLGIILEYIKKIENLEMSTNGNLSFRSFLPYLRRIIAEEDFEEFSFTDYVMEEGVLEQKSNSYDAEEMKALCYFYYNSAFKGLLFDGGVTNNLPASVFTFNTTTGATEQTLANSGNVLGLKVDNSFPQDIRNQIFALLDADKSGKTIQRLTNWQDDLAYYTFIRWAFRFRRLRQAFERNQAAASLTQKAWVKISKELLSDYVKSKAGFTPWNQQINAISGLINSLQFGMDQGQIQDIRDNENIIPLYTFGLDTFDFDLTPDDMGKIVAMAVEEAQNVVTTYFNGGTSAQ
jgi:predicted acylesterase/phospholipase RssA